MDVTTLDPTLEADVTRKRASRRRKVAPGQMGMFGTVKKAAVAAAVVEAVVRPTAPTPEARDGGQGWTQAELDAIQDRSLAFPTECRSCGAPAGQSCQHEVCHYPVYGRPGDSYRCGNAHPCPVHGDRGRYKTPLYCAGRPRMVGGDIKAD